MISLDCKHFTEIYFPIAKTLRHSARAESIRHGYPSTFHLWWAHGATANDE